MGRPGRQGHGEQPADAPAADDRMRAYRPGDGDDGVAIVAVRQKRRHYARGLRARIILRMEDGTPVARLLRP